MTEKIKIALLKWAKKVIDHQEQWDDEKTHLEIRKLYELSVVQKMFLDHEILDKNLWKKQQAELKEVLESLTGEDEEKDISKDEDLEVAPMMETIKNMVTEMPETHAYEKLFETFEEMPSFEPKNKDSLAKDSKSDIETVPEVKNINDHFAKNLSIDLNDRLAFIKNLFDGDTNTYDKVLSQIVTFESWPEVSTFLETQVKIEYNDWNDKEEIAKRFLTILKKHFDF
jgi:hypothetical protein